MIGIYVDFERLSSQVKYTVDYIHLSKHDYLNLDELQRQIIESNGDGSKKRAASWSFDSLILAYDLKCPLEAPAYKDHCG